MTKIANDKFSWLNKRMKNIDITIKDKFDLRYLQKSSSQALPKTSDINVLLNRIELNKKNESRKKLYFSAVASTGLLLFGFLIF
jgi:hypothetical protein